jgi:predicted ATPase
VKIKSINVKNYRCLKDVAFPIGDLSVLLGANAVLSNKWVTLSILEESGTVWSEIRIN